MERLKEWLTDWRVWFVVIQISAYIGVYVFAVSQQ